MIDPSAAPAPPRRLASIDAYRGLAMSLMMAEVLHLCEVARARPGSGFWRSLCHHQDHAEWVGCSLHDLIQPSFSLLVGVALPFSLAGRAARGQTTPGMIAHALWRAMVLVAIGIALRSIGRPRPNFTFEDTLSQIGLGYGFLFALGLRPVRDQWVALAILLAGTWAAFALYPLPGPDFDFPSVGVRADWPHHPTGFAAHWDKNSNLAWAFDTWFLNRFPRPEPFVHNGGGYATLSFVPTLGTMVLGLLAGGLLRSDRGPWSKVSRLAASGVVALASGWALGRLGICPVVKRIWTPSWVLFSGGWCLLALAMSYAILDVLGWRGWSFPLRVVGMNSIAAYCLSHLLERPLLGIFRLLLGHGVCRVLGPDFEPMLRGAAVLTALWLILFGMERRKLFLRV